jgi:hypothetical protein
MCFALFLFVTCFGWNFNNIAASAASVAVAKEDKEGCSGRGGSVNGGKYGRKVSSKVKRYGKYGRNAS